MKNSYGDSKVAVIKAVKSITGLGLRETKERVESAPIVIREEIDPEAARSYQEQLEEAGATVELHCRE